MSKQSNRKRHIAPVLCGFIALLLALTALSALYFRPEENSVSAIADHLVINEICADNKTLLVNNTAEYNDWVELYNPTDAAISLNGWTLSDNKTNLYQYTFPEDTTIEPGCFLIVYSNSLAADELLSESTNSASDEETDSTDTSGQQAEAAAEKAALELLSAVECSANFNIERTETVCLSQNGAVVDAVTVPNLQADTCYGRTTDGGNVLSVVSGTPGTTNSKAKVLALVAAPAFSADSGFYDSAFSLTIAAPEGCTIYYTLDGSTPTTDSTRYDGALTIEDATANPNKYVLEDDFVPLTDTPEGNLPGDHKKQPLDVDSLYTPYLTPQENVDKCTIVRAIAVDGSGAISDVSAASYFVGFADRTGFTDVSILSLVSDPDGLFSDETGIMVNGADYKNALANGKIATTTHWGYLKNICNFFKRGLNWERPVHIDYFDADQSLVFSQDAGIRLHGNSSRYSQTQKAFSLRARKSYDGNDTFLQPFFDSSTLTSRVNLVRGSYVRSYYLSDQLSSGRSADAQTYRLVQVFLDGEYWGCYAIQETYNDDYVENHYGLDSDDVVMLATGTEDLDLVMGEDGDKERYYDPLTEFAAGNDLSDPANYAKICTMMDVQSFIDMYAAELYIANIDWHWHQNIYIFRSKDTDPSNTYADGRWRWLIYDVDLSSGSNSKSPYSLDTFSTKRPYTVQNLLNDPLFQYLMKNDAFKEQFILTFMDFGNYVYSGDRVTADLTALMERYSEVSSVNSARYPGRTESKQLSNSLVGTCETVIDFFSKRFPYASDALAEFWDLQGDVVTLTVRTDQAEGGTIQVNTITPELTDGSWSGLYYTDVPVSLTAIPADGWVFVGWQSDSGALSDATAVTTAVTLSGETTTVTAVFQPAPDEVEQVAPEAE